MENKDKAIKQLLSYDWHPWIERPFGPFMVSVFSNSFTKESFSKIGFPKASMHAILFQDHQYYASEEVFDHFAKTLPSPEEKPVLRAVQELERFYLEQQQLIPRLCASRDPVIDRLILLQEILKKATSFIWLTHGLEQLYHHEAQEKVPLYTKIPVEDFLQTINVPKKKTASTLLTEALLKGENVKILAEQYGWLRVRDAFSDPFSEKDLQAMKASLPSAHKPTIPQIPKELIPFVEEIQELVYLRTARTDAFYHLLYLARPLLKEVAKHYDLGFEDLSRYPINALISGSMHSYGEQFSCVSDGYTEVFKEGPFLKVVKESNASSVQGMPAFEGIIKGRAKIVHDVSELWKVQESDILVCHMTFPSYITAMAKASAFVTDEGGITCHASIVAREMRKPCVIATKKATKVFKDGDSIEVDANKGIVRKITDL